MRRAGILLHPTSLPAGRLGSDAFAFIDWLARAGISAWQTLPLVAPGPGASPYCSISALALSAALAPPDAPEPNPATLARFADAAPWARELALFSALHQEYDAPFWAWPTPLRDREASALAAASLRHKGAIDRVLRGQCKAERAWQDIKRYAGDRGIAVIGDVPMYVDQDSVDVWCHREAFLLDASGRPTAVAGVPPDYFSAKGQLWGNPLYDWPALAKQGHSFWVQRMRRALALFDVVRIDHFRAFSDYWAVRKDAPDARSGEWRKGPGRLLFDDLTRALGPLPLIAEDLGTLDDAVHQLRDTLALPGMAILQFAFDGKDPTNLYLPHNHTRRSVVYTGTHDNDTTLGFWENAPEVVRDQVRRYFAVDGHDIVWDFMRSALSSVADTAIIPLQDVLSLPSSARMNTPGTAAGNWGWRMRSGSLHDGLADRLHGLLALYGRLPPRRI